MTDETGIAGQTVERFLQELASDSATPGGGPVAALEGAMGAALISMVCFLFLVGAAFSSGRLG